ncbi:MAG: undecaprenyl-phosphate glucose phosphotransferase [Ardenticatenaceae bacterium]|nr:undecaprenyl-phosphate glucose phosphotransferase [Ardenticatenaceae bacterium]
MENVKLKLKTQDLRNIYAFTLVLLDAALVGLSFSLAFIIRSRVPFPEPLVEGASFESYLGLMIIGMITVLATLFTFRLYYIPRATSRVDQFYALFPAVTLGTMLSVAISIFVFSPDFEFPRAMVIYAWMLMIILLMTGRVAHQETRVFLQRRGWGKDRTLIVGSDEMARIVLQRIIWSPRLGYDVVGLVAETANEVDDEEEMEAIAGIPIVGRIPDLPDLIDDLQIDEVIIAMPERGHRETVKVIAMCERGQVSIKIFPDIFQFVATQPSIDDLGGLPLLSVRDFAMRGYLLIFKRLFDILGSLFGLIFLSPLLVLVAVAIRLESPGSVFFVQDRMGLDGKPFRILKFRSMRSDAEKYGPGWTVDDDPRQTRLGRFLRKVDIDELPQFINVLLGEMSLVGPRPEQPYYVDQFRESVPRYMDRHQTKAGMTGWAQVNGLRGDTSIAERTKFDLWYIENWSLLLDIKILVRTVWQTLVGKNGE